MPRDIAVFEGLDPASYRRHSLHGEERTWVEKNCYIDLWIEILHSQGLEPLACLPFTLAIDFEGDQWTFFKPPHDELRELYGLDVQELTVWRPLIDHVREHLAGGKLISTEADAFWLPDTAGTDYRSKHTKTTIAINALDETAQSIGYFHNAGYYRLEDEDFRRTFRLDAAPDDAFMPLFAEFVRVDRLQRHEARPLAARSLQLLQRHFARRPAQNPVARFAKRLQADLPLLAEHGLPHYHAWAFGTVRQLGAAFELSAAHLQWLASLGHGGIDSAVPDFMRIATLNKALILKAARAVNARRALDAQALLAEMAEAWDTGMGRLGHALRAG